MPTFGPLDRRAALKHLTTRLALILHEPDSEPGDVQATLDAACLVLNNKPVSLYDKGGLEFHFRPDGEGS